MNRYDFDRATEDDVPVLVVLLGELFSIEQDFVPDAGRQAAGLRLLLRDSERAAIWVARGPRGEPVGMASAQLVVSTAQGALSAWIEDVVVGRAHRGRGLGRALLKTALEWARAAGATRAQLLIDTDNAPAILFYDRLGWQSTHLAARRMLLEHK